jgi:hypothetical protein
MPAIAPMLQVADVFVVDYNCAVVDIVESVKKL